MASPLISAVDLAAALAGDHPPVVLDVRWSLAGADIGAFLDGHLPGALFVDLDAELAASPGDGGRHPLPDPTDLQDLWRDLGLHDDTAVVVYDAGDATVAGRAWWLLRWSGHRPAQVLDGGWAAWERAGHPVESGEAPRPGGGSATVRPGGMPVVGLHEVDAVVRARSAADTGPDDGDAGDPATAVLVDLRAAARYRGEVEPVDPVAGHIPGAVNLPAAGVVEPDGTFPPARILAARLAAAGVVPGRPVIASCGSGVTACQLVLAGDLLGIRVALYPGSYSGWCAAGRPVVTSVAGG